MNKELFTIIATVWNEKETISDFIDSLLSQSSNANEIIIVDGASTDGTLEILQEYEKNGQIKLISQPCNIAEGRNLGIDLAESEYIAVTDAGCVVDQDWLSAFKTVAAENPEADVLAGNFHFDSHNAFERASVYATFNPNREQSDTAIYYPSSRSLAFKKQAWTKAKGYPNWIKVSEDTLYNIRLRQVGCKFVFAKEAIVRWRPRTSLKALAKQRFNFARCNSQVNHGVYGYKLNILYHGAILFPLLLSPISLYLGLLSLVPAYIHVKRNLWRQASFAASDSGDGKMRWRVLLIMEFIRLTNISGFCLGQLDRKLKPELVERQVEWMGSSRVVIPQS